MLDLACRNVASEERENSRDEELGPLVLHGQQRPVQVVSVPQLAEVQPEYNELLFASESILRANDGAILEYQKVVAESLPDSRYRNFSRIERTGDDEFGLRRSQAIRTAGIGYEVHEAGG